MNVSPINLLLFHGSLLLLVGNLCGVPFGQAITRRKPDDVVRAWRVAHSGNTSGGGVAIASAAAISISGLSVVEGWIIAIPLIAACYGFGIALPVGAQLGARGLVMKGSTANRFVFAGNAIGAIGSLIGSVALVVFLALRVVR
jgi:hypothetical protein